MFIREVLGSRFCIIKLYFIVHGLSIIALRRPPASTSPRCRVTSRCVDVDVMSGNIAVAQY